MAPKPVTAIKENYSTYSKLCKERKTVTSKRIDVIKIKPQHPNLKIGKSPVVHASLKDYMNFEVEVKINNTKDFKFKLHCPEVFERPFFRFDSAGATHFNPDFEMPLKERQVKTPHFHKFNNEGYERAYQTNPLKDEVQKIALEDINVCLMHFCDEGNIRLDNDDFPEIVLDKTELGITFTNEDPHQNIDF